MPRLTASNPAWSCCTGGLGSRPTPASAVCVRSQERPRPCCEPQADPFPAPPRLAENPFGAGGCQPSYPALKACFHVCRKGGSGLELSRKDEKQASSHCSVIDLDVEHWFLTSVELQTLLEPMNSHLQECRDARPSNTVLKHKGPLKTAMDPALKLALPRGRYCGTADKLSSGCQIPYWRVWDQALSPCPIHLSACAHFGKY